MINEQLELDLGNITPSIDILPLTPRQNRALKDKGICTIACLVEISKDSYNGLGGYLLRNKFFGRKTYTNVVKKLDELEIAYKY